MINIERNFEQRLSENMGMIMNLAMRHAEYYSVPLDLMVQAGRIATWSATKKFRSDRGCKFLTYLCIWCRGVMQKMARKERSTVNVSLARQARDGVQIYIPLDAPTTRHPNSPTTYDLLEEPDRRPEVSREELQIAIQTLPPKLARPIELYFLEDLPLPQVGARLGGITGEAARHRVMNGLKQLRRYFLLDMQRSQ